MLIIPTWTSEFDPYAYQKNKMYLPILFRNPNVRPLLVNQQFMMTWSLGFSPDNYIDQSTMQIVCNNRSWLLNKNFYAQIFSNFSLQLVQRW